MFRTVPLPDDLPGALYLHSMPGCFEAFDDAREAIVDNGIAAVVCLNPHDEVEYESPDYAEAIARGIDAWEQLNFPIPDRGAPDDREAFLGLTRAVARRLERGEGVLVHCYAGIGRTGTLASCVLMALGLEQDEALRVVNESGSGPEGHAQLELVRWCAGELLR
jgi:protein-tyrosine phosphatase